MAPSILGVSNGSGLFRSNRIAGPTCPNKEVWILAMLYVMFYVVISKISAHGRASLLKQFVAPSSIYLSISICFSVFIILHYCVLFHIDLCWMRNGYNFDWSESDSGCMCNGYISCGRGAAIQLEGRFPQGAAITSLSLRQEGRFPQGAAITSLSLKMIGNTRPARIACYSYHGRWSGRAG